MALSSTTDWCKIRYIMFVIHFVSILLDTTASGLVERQKRQLFREQLLPQTGGKIPSSAFEPDRLVINKLSQNGFFSLDGHHLDQRHPHRQRSEKPLDPNVIRVSTIPDGRYVAPPGRSPNSQSIATTYLVRQPVHYSLSPRFERYHSLPQVPFYSLKYVREFRKNDATGSNYVSGTAATADKILKQLRPYLRQIHETD